MPFHAIAFWGRPTGQDKSITIPPTGPSIQEWERTKQSNKNNNGLTLQQIIAVVLSVVYDYDAVDGKKTL